MRFDPELAEFRFGYGLSPDLPAPGSAAEMLDLLAGPDVMAARLPLPGFETILPRMAAVQDALRARRASPGRQAEAAFLETRKALVRELRRERPVWLGRHLARRSGTRDAFRERLVVFWADHFTARGKTAVSGLAMTPHVESAIRPHVTGRFADLLAHAVKAPLMLEYLDQRGSRGPQSAAARDRGPDVGLNENLAREVLELHTLGVDGPYGQADVRQLAELLTGLSFNFRKGTAFHPRLAEPGAETVLGRTYGGGRARMGDIDAVLADLAVHPATAAHIAHKLAVHFVADDPDPALVAALEARFAGTGGDLMAVYAVLLDHPAAWDPVPGNLRPPLSWVSAATRALGVPAAALDPVRNKDFFRALPKALARMGQPYEAPPGPDGWAEEDAAWLTPQGLAARLQWSFSAPPLILPDLPDPRDFAARALGTRLGDRLRFAAAAAESRGDGIGLILAAPEFQRS